MKDLKCCVLIPYRDGIGMLAECLASLQEDLPADTTILLVDDGSVADQSAISSNLNDLHIAVLRNATSLGPAAARNKGIAWCRERGVKILILLDSDCVPEHGFVAKHIYLHGEMPDVVCIGGGIRGRGRSYWARLDCIASWFTSLPESGARNVGPLVHIPTTNMSLKLQQLPFSGDLFNERLRTGEDVEFLRRLMAAGGRVKFSPIPIIAHRDRDDFRGFLRHQYRWAVHTYAVRSDAKHSLTARVILGMAFFLLIPVYALVSSVLNVVPWLKVSPAKILWWPLLFVLYSIKGLGVVEGIFFPNHALYPARGNQGLRLP